ncbi:hypothetical protein PAMC26577_37545 [Caballeronia sordidicola]|uniref:Uncharacterized protein n=1 Tax=Caballeronia sordidicola TaxID=196367 RepID=A0A242M614_CABSO|nr:hypothetical protein PAMC26577_37545 [Caballeronia sordidicola]
MSAGVFDGGEAFREVRAILERLELRFGEWGCCAIHAGGCGYA